MLGAAGSGASPRQGPRGRCSHHSSRGGTELTKLAASMMPSSTGCVQSSVNFRTCFFFLPPFAAGFFCCRGKESEIE